MKFFTKNFLMESLVAVFLCLPLYGSSLKSQDTMSFQQADTSKVKLKDLIMTLQSYYQISILFEDEVLDKYYVNKNSFNAKSSAETNLKNILHQFNLQYKKSKKNSYIILNPEKKSGKTEKNGMGANETGEEHQTTAARVVLSGKVTDDGNQPLEGVSIAVLGTAFGTVSDHKGDYTLSIDDAARTGKVVFSYIGYLTREVDYTGDQVINISLQKDIKDLDEVVVVGYGTQKKRDLTGSVSSVNMDEIKSAPVANIGEAIEGRMAGVQVISSGSPGSNVTFRIRGTGTINNSDPLIVIDGVPMDAPLNNLNNNDIESIEVLKDASASAIYGSRGANGVVLITTKKGVKNKNQLSFNYNIGFQNPTNVVKMLNASQFAALHNDMMVNNGQPTNPAYADPASLGAGTDWLGALFRTAPMHNISLSYSGGTDKTNYYVSGSILDQDGIVINTGYRRYALQLNTDSKVFDWLKFGNNVTFTTDVKTNGDYNIRNTMAALPVQPILNADGTYSGPEGQSSWYGDISNPIGRANIIENKTTGYNLLGSIFGEVNITRNLKFRSTGGLQANFWNTRNWSPKYDWKPIPSPNSYLAESYNKGLTWLWDNYLTYNTLIGDDHDLTVLVGTSAQSNKFSYINGAISNFASDKTQQLNNGNAQVVLGGNANEWSLLSYIGRINYAYKDKYLLTATLRRDGSSRFGKNNRWGTFPSASAAWRLSEEDFIKNVSFLNDLKLRVGYGITGNQNIGNYSFASVLKTVVYNFNGVNVPAVIPQSIPNPNIKWETVEQSNLGIDASILNNRVTIALDGYIKNTSNMLVPMSVPISTGYSDIVVPYINAGKVQNKGVELAVTTKNLRGKLGWTTSFNVSYNKNKIVNLNDTIPLVTGSIGLNDNLAIQQSGHPINTFYGFVTDGIFQSQSEVDAHASQVPGVDPYNRTSAGDIRFKDLNSDGRIDDNDRTFIGNPNPSFIFAMNNTVSYMGLDLSIFLQGVSGNKIFNANRIYQEGMAVAQNQTAATLNRWNGEGTSNDMPRAIFNDPNKNTRPSDRFIEDGSYLRIKNITLGYTFPESMVKKAKISSARIYVSCQNLFTFTKYTGFDPEVSSNGIDFSLYPVTRTISFGVNINL